MIKTTKERADIQVTWIDIVEFNERQIFKAFPVTRSKAVPSSHIMQNNLKNPVAKQDYLLCGALNHFICIFFSFCFTVKL